MKHCFKKSVSQLFSSVTEFTLLTALKASDCESTVAYSSLCSLGFHQLLIKLQFSCHMIHKANCKVFIVLCNCNCM